MSLASLHAALAAEGGTVAEALVAVPPPEPEHTTPAMLAAAGPRAAGRGAEYELLLELVHEGALLHYAAPRVFESADPDLALLLGDRLYALGLERLAALGDLEAVGELGELISLLVQAHLRGEEALAAAIWEAGATAIGWGSDPAVRAAQSLARCEDVRATQVLLRAAAGRRGGAAGRGAAEIDGR